MTDSEIYQKLREGVNPRYIEGLTGFDSSEVVQWMISYHDEVSGALAESLSEMIAGHEHRSDAGMFDMLCHGDQIDAANKALANFNG